METHRECTLNTREKQGIDAGEGFEGFYWDI
jgi:hypothetical protein